MRSWFGGRCGPASWHIAGARSDNQRPSRERSGKERNRPRTGKSSGWRWGRRDPQAIPTAGDGTPLGYDPRVPTPVLVSACLLGRTCRYDGRHNRDFELERRLAAEQLEPVPFCPEEHGGLGTPRSPAWIETGGAAAVLDGVARMVTDDGRDVTAEFLRGAAGALAACRERGITRAFLKERSPSCGVCATHVGGACVDGPGVTAEELRRAGIRVEGIEGRRKSGEQPD